MSDTTNPTPTNRERVERILDLTIEKLEQSLADTDRPSPALITAVIRLARECGIDFQKNGEPMTPGFDPILESLKDLDLRQLGLDDYDSKVQ